MSTVAAQKVCIRSITIHRVEGPTIQCTQTTHNTWKAANDRLRSICNSIKQDQLGYDKCDFKIVFADGEVYEGRFDAAHPDSRSYSSPDLTKHIKEYLTFAAGLRCPSHLTEEQYENTLAEMYKAYPSIRDKSTAFLTRYALEDGLIVDAPKSDNLKGINDKLDMLIRSVAAAITELESEAAKHQATDRSLATQILNKSLHVRKALLAIERAQKDTQ